MTTGMIRLNVDEWYVDRGPWVLDAHRAVAMVLESLRIRTAQGLDCSAFSEGARDVTLMSDLNCAVSDVTANIIICYASDVLCVNRDMKMM